MLEESYDMESIVLCDKKKMESIVLFCPFDLSRVITQFSFSIVMVFTHLRAIPNYFLSSMDSQIIIKEPRIYLLVPLKHTICMS